MGQEIVTVALAANNEYSPYLATTIQSIISHINNQREYEIVVLHSSITEENQLKIISMAEEIDSVTIRFFDMAELIQDNVFYVGGKKGLTAETYYRLYIPCILPDRKKVIYLDCDMIVLDDIAKLYDTDLEGHLLGSSIDYCAIGNYYMPGHPQKKYWDNVLQLDNPEAYFCAGMLVLNLDELRKIGTATIIALATEFKWEKHDQDVLNILAKNKLKLVHPAWDVLKEFGETTYLPSHIMKQVQEAVNDPKIIHYSSSYKPWNTAFVDRFSFFWEYASKTPFFIEIINRISGLDAYRCYVIQHFSVNKEVSYLPIPNDMLVYQREEDIYLGRLGKNFTKIENISIDQDFLYIKGKTMLMGLETKNDVEVLLDVNGEKIQCEVSEKDFSQVKEGKRVYLGIGFSNKIKLPDTKECIVKLYCKIGEHFIQKQRFTFGKFAPLAEEYKNQYYYGSGKILRVSEGTIVIKKCSKYELIKQELKFEKELLGSREIYKKKAAIIRLGYFITKPLYRKDIWLFSDRANKADDNGEALFNYVQKKKPGIKSYYVIDKRSSDYDRMKSQGRVVDSLSWKHKWLFLHCKNNISSQADDNTIYPFRGSTSAYADILSRIQFVFLQHGVIKEDMSATYNRTNQNMSIFVTAAKPEYQSILGTPEYECDSTITKLTGLPRHDRLYNDPQKIITLMPTWRKYLFRHKPGYVGVWEPTEQFVESDYFKFYNSLINNTRLIDAAAKLGYKIRFMPHPNVQSAIDYFDKNPYVEFYPLITPYSKIFAESDLIITDRSSAIMDFAYLRKPIVYCLFDDDAFMAGEHVYTKGYFDYERDGFGEVEYNMEDLIDRVIEYMENGCKLKQKYHARIENFFAYNDKENCQRVYEEILKLKE